MRADYLDFPYQIDGRGRTGETGEDDHIRDLIYQVLFTNPGERLNRPDFGCGIAQLVFAPNSDALAATTQFLVLGALSRWLDSVILVRGVQVAPRDSTLVVTVSFTKRSTGEARDEHFTSSLV